MILESSDDFTICIVCAGLAGFPSGRSDYPQVCRCNKADQPRWPDHDFNEYFDLCWCCLLEPISSGSKWSSFYCEGCRQRVRGYNESMGRVLLYLGCHSIMNGLGLRGRDAAVPEAVAAFGSALGRFGTGLLGFYEGMSTWRPDRLRVVLRLIALPPGTGPQELGLAEYLKAAEGLVDHPRFGKRAAFSALCGFLGLPAVPGQT
ncbi:MAG: hypothetical protein ABIJ48_10075 [Actinomycetota bacterium]